ncbi:DUF2946 domain-containing protein [Janthinobacterium sp. RB2R34]|uniref:DUF2946 domain-containing protein n=1 Tax=Janthinobacterium sp. RB2R34 TaxID=3424193 RepID=UPI003F1E4D0A
MSLYPSIKRKTLQIWLAILAVLFAAVAPSISHALAAPAAAIPSSLLMQICTVDGVMDVSVDVKKSAMDPVVHAFEHCPYCSTHAGSFALLPGLSLSFAVSGGHDVYPPLYYHAPAPLFLWSSGNPRAPPVLS